MDDLDTRVEIEAERIATDFLKIANIPAVVDERKHLPGTRDGDEQFQIYFTVEDTAAGLVIVYHPEQPEDLRLYANYIAKVIPKENPDAFENSELITRMAQAASSTKLRFYIPKNHEIFSVSPKKLMDGRPVVAVRASGMLNETNYNSDALFVGELNRAILGYINP